jgi:nucleoside-diphosphate-sugar epimerase
VAAVNSACVIGRHGFLGGAIAKRLGQVSSFPTPETKVLFHFGSHVHPVFESNPEYLMKQTLDSFTQLLPLCQERGILFVYPSSALVYEKETQFSRFKKTLESLAACYKTRTLGLRIFPAYGPGEDRTVISQWCQMMKNGERPVVYGDGTQSRDFIFLDDVVDQILLLSELQLWTSRVADVGTGIRTSFNEIVSQINAALGTSIEPKYVDRPSSYSEGIACVSPLPVKVSIETGIRRILAQ